MRKCGDLQAARAAGKDEVSMNCAFQQVATTGRARVSNNSKGTGTVFLHPLEAVFSLS